MSDEIMANESVEQPVEQAESMEQSTKTFSQDELDAIVEQRLMRERKKYEKKLEGVDLDEARQLLQAKQEQEIERQKEKGEFESVLKQTVEKKDLEIAAMRMALETTKIDGALLTAASRHNAVDSEQVSQLLRNRVKLSDDGSVEVLDDNGAVRYNDKADPLSVDELVGDFLTANPHFVRASQGGAGTQGMAGGSTQKPISVADMVENWNDGGREAFHALKKKAK